MTYTKLLHNNTAIQSSKLSSGDNLSIDAGNNLILATAKDAAIKNEENKSGTAYAFSNGTSGYVDVKAVNNEITSNTNGTVNSNLSITATNSILAQYRAGTMEDVISGANTSNQQLTYLKTVNDLAQADPSKVTLDPIADTMKQWDQTTRGLTGAGQAGVAVAAVAIAIGTGGIGSGISGAMMTAVATTAGTTATISATNASMNTDSSVWGSTKSISSDTWRNTTSDESLRNMAIAAAVAGAGYGVGEWMKSEGVNPSFESGSMENSRVGVNAKYNDNGVLIKEGSITIQNPNGIEVNYWASNQNQAFKALNTTPGGPSFANFHDAMNFPVGVNQVTIAPYYAMSQCAAAPTLCAMFPDTFIKVGTWGQVNTNLDNYKNNYEQKNN